MNNIQSAWSDFRFLDDLAAKNTVVHRLHPLVKLLTALAFISAVVSFPKYDVIKILPLIVYPLTVLILAELPLGFFLTKLALAAPFVLFVGIFNPIFDKSHWITIGPLAVSGGWLSFISMILKFSLTVETALLLVATSGLNEIGAALLRLRMPKAFVTQLLLLYRYLAVLTEETASVIRSYSLRSMENRGVKYKVWGSLIGHLLLRTIDRAGRIYQAMLCRGFNGELKYLRPYRVSFKDVFYLTVWVLLFLAARLYNLPELMGSLVMGVVK